MNRIDMFKDKITQTVSNDPVIWGKWLLVFMVVILTYIVIIKFKIYEKIDPSTKLDKKVKKAIENKHIINATLISSYVDEENNTCGGKYEYEINGKKRKYNAMFSGRYARWILHLYYEDNPRKVFTNEEMHYYTLRAIPLIILIFLPWLVGAFMAVILGLVN